MNVVKITIQDHLLTNEDVLNIHKPESTPIRWDLVDDETGVVTHEGDGGYGTADAAVEAARAYATREGLMDS